MNPDAGLSLLVPDLACAPTRRQSRPRPWRAAWARFAAHPSGRLGLGLVGAFALMAAAHPILLATVWEPRVYDPLTGFDGDAPFSGPISWAHWLGTDSMGRDVLSQLLHAAGPSLAFGLLAGIVAVSVGTAVGTCAAYRGGAWDATLMGVADACALLPPPVVLLIAGLSIELDWVRLGLLYGLLVGLGPLAILARTHALSVLVRAYVDAARVAGARDWHVVRVHVLPALIPFMLLHMAFTVSGAVLTEAALSFFGRTPIRLSWGTMILMGQQAFRWAQWDGQWHVLIPPALAIGLFCGAFHMVGMGLEETLDPRGRR